MFLERLRVFSDDNKYYKPGGEYNELGPNDSRQIPNCTRFCLSRVYEACEKKVKGVARIGTYSWGDAKLWWAETGLQKGYKLKQGSIAVFDGNYGHVCFVERVIDDTHAIISHSLYTEDKTVRNYHYYQCREVELVVGKATISGVGPLLGFIYLPINDKRVKENETKNQIEVIDTYLNVRKTPAGLITNSGCYCPMGRYDVLEIVNDGLYDWYKIDNECYVREGEWLNFYPKKDDEIAKLKDKIRRIQEIINEE